MILFVSDFFLILACRIIVKSISFQGTIIPHKAAMTIIQNNSIYNDPPLISILTPIKILPLPLSLSFMLALPVSQMTCHVLIMWLSCGTLTKPWRKVCNHHYLHHCYYQKPSNPPNWKSGYKDGSITIELYRHYHKSLILQPQVSVVSQARSSKSHLLEFFFYKVY